MDREGEGGGGWWVEDAGKGSGKADKGDKDKRDANAKNDADDVWLTLRAFLHENEGRELLEDPEVPKAFVDGLLEQTPPSERKQPKPPTRPLVDPYKDLKRLKPLMLFFIAETSGSRRDRSTKNLRSYLHGFVEWVETTLRVSDPPLSYLSHQVVQLYVYWLQHPRPGRDPEMYSQSYVESILKALRHFESWLWREGSDDRRLKERTLQRVKYQTPAEEGRRPLSDDERERVINAAGVGYLGGTWQSIVKVLLGTGLRADELTQLMLSSVNPSDGVVELQARMVKGKKRPRRVTLWPDVEKAIRDYVRNYRRGTQGPSDPLFTNREGERYHVSGIQRIFRSLKVSTGIEDLCAHQMRTTFSVNYCRAGCGNLLQLATELGHSKKTGLRMTARYADIVPLGDKAIGKTPLSVRSTRAGEPIYGRDYEVVERHRRGKGKSA